MREEQPFMCYCRKSAYMQDKIEVFRLITQVGLYM